jgi:hypothetical protein
VIPFIVTFERPNIESRQTGTLQEILVERSEIGGTMAAAAFKLEGRLVDQYFFPGRAILMLGPAFPGFARAYFLAGVFKAPLASWILHVHEAVFFGVGLAVDRADVVGSGGAC